MQKVLFYRNKRKESFRLEELISRYNTFEEFEREFPDELLNDDSQVGDYLEELLHKYGKKASAVSEDAGRSTSYVGHIINGRRVPSRNTLISICFAIGTTFEEAQYLLKYSGHAPLYVRRKRDVVIWFGFLKGQDIDTVNGTLIERGMKPLIDEK